MSDSSDSGTDEAYDSDEPISETLLIPVESPSGGASETVLRDV
jgi:hypothetical protein